MIIRWFELEYDNQGRRAQKRVWTWQSGDWALTQTRKFVWDGWLMVLELESGVGVPPASDMIVRKYTWGLDLGGVSGNVASGPPRADSTGRPGDGGYGAPPGVGGGVGILPASLQGAGGIGGLLAMEAPQTVGDPLKYVYLYDANGNVGQLIDWSHDPNDLAGAIVAHYEYDPYGNVTASSGSYADENPIRFSTKYFDAETGLGYWGYRYYSPSLGRWISRDPLGEGAWLNLYVALANSTTGSIDVLGLFIGPYGDFPKSRSGTIEYDVGNGDLNVRYTWRVASRKIRQCGFRKEYNRCGETKGANVEIVPKGFVTGWNQVSWTVGWNAVPKSGPYTNRNLEIEAENAFAAATADAGFCQHEYIHIDSKTDSDRMFVRGCSCLIVRSFIDIEVSVFSGVGRITDYAYYYVGGIMPIRFSKTYTWSDNGTWIRKKVRMIKYAGKCNGRTCEDPRANDPTFQCEHTRDWELEEGLQRQAWGWDDAD